MVSVNQLVDTLVRASPEIEALRTEHLGDHGELLPHVFFGDLTRWLANNPAESRILALLGQALSDGDAATRDLIYASFLENIEPGDEYAALREALRPHLPQLWEDLYGSGGDPAAHT